MSRRLIWPSKTKCDRTSGPEKNWKRFPGDHLKLVNGIASPFSSTILPGSPGFVILAAAHLATGNSDSKMLPFLKCS
jgi:hypothetical protein